LKRALSFLTIRPPLAFAAIRNHSVFLRDDRTGVKAILP
jgi:hypothetical protein